MNRGIWCRRLWRAVVACTILGSVQFLSAQASSNQRHFSQSKAEVEKALKAIAASEAGHLPALEGFAQPGAHPLDRYERGYYQATVQVDAVPSGGSRVQVSVKVTAWYKDPAAAHSGYELLSSNGRLESDLLDHLAEQLVKDHGAEASKSVPATQASPSNSDGGQGSPAPDAPKVVRDFSSSFSQSLSAHEQANLRNQESSDAEKGDSALRAEAQSLEQTLKNQAHPKNLVAVKKSGTPVVSTPSLTAKPLFLASLHDEFEMLDFNADWVHVRISGLSRGWIWRNSLEMPEGIPDTVASPASAQVPAANLFHVTREETSMFPGDWEPLRGKNVKIVSVQKIDDNAKEPGSKERLEYAKFLLEKGYAELASKPQDLAGIVLIFDSADGGMIAATLSTLKDWKAGALSDAALWHKCFFDPPETFDSAGSAASQ